MCAGTEDKTLAGGCGWPEGGFAGATVTLGFTSGGEFEVEVAEVAEVGEGFTGVTMTLGFTSGVEFEVEAAEEAEDGGREGLRSSNSGRR